MPPYLRFCLGTAQIGFAYGRTNLTGQPSKVEAHNIVTMALRAGVLSIDTARGYGVAEELLGELHGEIAQYAAEIVTKLDPLPTLHADAGAETVAAAVDASIENSRRALQVSTLDVLLLHRWAHYRAFHGEIWRRVKMHKQRGTIARLGASIYTPQEALEALEESEIQHLQLPYNILDRRWNDAGIDGVLAGRPDVTIHARSVFLQGVLLADAQIWPNIESGQARHIVEALESLVKELKLSTRAQLCVAFVLSQPWVHRLVLGVERTDQLLENLSLFDTRTLNPEELDRISQLLARVPDRFLDPSQWPTKGSERADDLKSSE